MMSLIFKILKSIVLGLCLFVFLNSTAYAEDNASPVGFWQTTDEASKLPASVIQIWQQDGMLYGKVIKIYPQSGHSEADICTACTGELHNKPIRGLMILSGLRQQNSEWVDGKILAPKTGKIYNASIKLTDNGNQLLVTAKAGFGSRTQTWIRVLPTK